MKQVKIALVALLVFVGFNKANAQDSNNPWAIKVGVNAVDYHPTNYPGNLTDLGQDSGWFHEFFNAEDHYNIIPTISSLTVGRYLNNGFSLEVGADVNKITTVGNNPESNPGDLALLNADANVKYSLMNLFGKEGYWFDPFLTVGGGYTWLDWKGTGTLNGGAGLNFWLTENVGLTLSTEYKHAFDDLYMPYFQHFGGLNVKFGGSDKDGDGIYDKDDACPEVFGLKAFNGCPDTDGDGIADKDDDCPEVAGTAAFKGCPDTDGDGIVDKNDDCPEVKGLAALKGCPDTDGDGVADKNDGCVTVAGPKENKGCPWPDTDGDGILDKDDACPTVAGVREERGCPAKPKEVITKEAKAQLDAFARNVYFNTSKDTFTPGTTAQLDKIAEIMAQYPDANFTIDGHTDSDGSDAMNLDLSKRRAAAVERYLAGKGISAARLTSAGFGESRPVADNKTKEGKAQNRRVEINLR